MLQARGKRGDVVKVVDFGIAGLMHAEKGKEDVIAGTPDYIAPERAAGRDYDQRSDIYSLGAMAYEMLSGDIPFHGKNPGATLMMHLKDPPEPLGPDAGPRSPRRSRRWSCGCSRRIRRRGRPAWRRWRR